MTMNHTVLQFKRHRSHPSSVQVEVQVFECIIEFSVIGSCIKSTAMSCIVTSGGEYSDILVDRRVNCTCYEYPFRGDSSIGCDLPPFYCTFEATTQDLCSVHVNMHTHTLSASVNAIMASMQVKDDSVNTVTPWYPSPHQLGS